MYVLKTRRVGTKTKRTKRRTKRAKGRIGGGRGRLGTGRGRMQHGKGKFDKGPGDRMYRPKDGSGPGGKIWKNILSLPMKTMGKLMALNPKKFSGIPKFKRKKPLFYTKASKKPSKKFGYAMKDPKYRP